MLRAGEGRVPVVAAREGEEEHALPAQLGIGEEGVDVVLVEAIDGAVVVGGSRIVDGVGGEEVGRSLEAALVALVLILRALERTTDVGADGEIAQRLVDVGHQVAIESLVGDVLILVETVGAVGEEVDGGGVALILKFRVGAIEAQTSRHVEPGGDLILQAGVGHVAVLVVDAVHALGHPVGVLHLERVAEVPVLHIDAAGGVPDLEGADRIEALTTWEEVERHERVEVLALCHEVAIVLVDVAEAEVERQFVVQELCRVAHREVVAVVLVVGDDTACVGRTHGEVGLVAVVADGQRDVVLDVRTCVEEVLRFEAAIGRTALLAPGAYLARTVGVAVLELRHLERTEELATIGDRHLHAALAALLGGDHDDTLGGSGTIEGGSGRTAEHADGLDVLRVDVGDALTTRLGGVDASRLAVVAVVDGHTIDDVEGLVALVDGLRTTHHHAGRTAHTCR